MGLERHPLLADESLTGRAWCRRHSALVDEWVAGLLHATIGDRHEGLALVAVGGYGRAELCPQSDIDLMLVHDRRRDIAAVADRIWYPIWDEGIKLGHSVCTVREALGLANDDLDSATALLSARRVAGDDALVDALGAGAIDQWRKRSKRWLTELAARNDLRQAKAGEVAFQLEPDLKEGRGGMRDVHALGWAQAARQILLDHDSQSLDGSYGVLLDARVELQRRSGRPSNILGLADQAAVAKALGDADADALMARVAMAARSIAWTSDDTWHRIRSGLRGPLARGGRTRPLAAGVVLRDGEVHVDAGGDEDRDPTLALRAAAGAVAHDTIIDRQSLERLAATAPALGDPWPADARSLLVELLLSGRPAVRVVESLDQRGVWCRVIPEWQGVRARPQRDAYHRYTVDRHLLEATAEAARLAPSVDRGDLLVVAALLHGLSPGDVDGDEGDGAARAAVLAGDIATRMGFPVDDASAVAALVRHHLLLAEVAVRRDLDDPTTIERVAAAVGSTAQLELLAALTEADSVATGPSAWGPAKSALVDQLVERVAHLLDGGSAEPVTAPFPTADQLARLSEGEDGIDAGGGVLTVMTENRPGIFGRIAGVLALHGLDVESAAAFGNDEGRALAEFRVSHRTRTEMPWARVEADLRLALDGRLAVNARLAERAQTYARAGRRPVAVGGTRVTFDEHASTDATVIDVQTADGIGVLYRIFTALGELDLDIRSARVQTLGSRVVDAFYARDARGAKITDPHTLGEIERAIVHGLDGAPGS
ncbi:MAG: [protein-PII] uridylyltransferase [Acidimicrobiaceae bacterium]